MADVERKLTTILATDAVSFSGMMGRDEQGTLLILKASSKLIEGCIDQHRGRVFGGAGDSMIAEFSSPLSAVQCARAFQKKIAERNLASPEEQRMWFRAGINMADLMVDGDNLFGEGVNIAARLEQVGEPGGVCVSQKVYEEIHRNIDAPFVDGGAPVLKNIGQPIHVFHIRPADIFPDLLPGIAAKVQPAPVAAPTGDGAPKTLSIRPFKIAGGEDVEFLAEGLREGLLKSLSSHATIGVVREDANDGAAFSLEGSVRGRGERLRLSFSLIDNTEHRQIWSERYDRRGDDVFDLEDEISRTVSSVIRIKLKEVEFERLRDTADENLSVADLLDKAAAFFVHGTTDNDKIEASLRLALARDPDNSMAHAMLAFCLHRGFEFSPLALPEASEKTIADLADRAVALQADSYFAHLVAGIVAQDVHGDFGRALRHGQAALASNPDFTPAHALTGIAGFHLGQTEMGIAELQSALDFNREDPHRFRYQRELALAHFVSDDLDAATEMIDRLVQSEPLMDRNRLVQAALLSANGDAEAANSALLQLRAKHTGLSLLSKRPVRVGRADAAARFDEAIAAAGLA